MSKLWLYHKPLAALTADQLDPPSSGSVQIAVSTVEA